MSDEFIREVQEEYRRDQITRIWTRYSGLIVGFFLVLLIGIGSWRYWQHVELTRAEAAALRFHEANRLAADGKTQEAEAALRTLANEAENGYQLLARFRLAAELGKQDGEGGAKAFDALAADAAVPPTLQDLARLRAAMLRLDGSDPASVAQSLEGLAAPTNPFRHSARELLGLAALKRGDYDAAGRWFDQIAADRETPQPIRSRLEIYAALVAGGPVQVTQ